MHMLILKYHVNVILTCAYMYICILTNYNIIYCNNMHESPLSLRIIRIKNKNNVVFLSVSFKSKE